MVVGRSNTGVSLAFSYTSAGGSLAENGLHQTYA